MQCKPELKDIPVEQLTKGKYQPRRHFDPVAIQELADSIKKNGLIQPIVIRPLTKEAYEIIAGERRWRASQLAGLATVRCLINHYTDAQAAAVTTIENINREDLNPIEEAQAYQRLIKEFSYTHEEVAAIVGKSRVKITNSLRLLELDNQVQLFLFEGQLSEGHGKLLAGVSSHSQYGLAKKAVDEQWSTRRLEQEIKKIGGREQKINATEDSNILAFEKFMSEKLGSEVKIERTEQEKGGWLKIRYYNNDILEGILEKMGVKNERD